MEDKFNSIEDITLENLYNAAQVIANYQKYLCSDNDYLIRNTQKFPKLRTSYLKYAQS